MLSPVPHRFFVPPPSELGGRGKSMERCGHRHGRVQGQVLQDQEYRGPVPGEQNEQTKQFQGKQQRQQEQHQSQLLHFSSRSITRYLVGARRAYRQGSIMNTYICAATIFDVRLTILMY